MKKILLLFVSLFSVGLGFAQQIGDGYAQTINSFNSILNTGIYDSDKIQTNYPYEIPQWPWKYLFVMRHNDSNLNYQFQISTTFEHDDRIFFRKLAHLKTDTEYNNNWQEFATRGVNTFNGVQTINGDQYVNGNIHVNKYLFIPSNRELIFGNPSDRDHSLRISYNGNDNNGSCYINYSGDLRYRNGSMTDDVPVVLFSKDNNVGIGTLDPQGYKLAVNGTIRAKEIKVDSDWADFVFKKDYKLPTLGEVKKHITEKGTLPGIPSESDVKANGVSLGEVNALLLQKVEELTLYVIKLQEEVNELKTQKK
ncbi:hypothetical protein [Bacteroides sp. 41_26]|uniref:hypothetical protein n=1 Tax=Bacteroides sp. 41_26 TaxID=1896973 RepID=UPI00259CEBAB|nr:hypothetical protein [Bacteroides sp. 41_26]